MVNMSCVVDLLYNMYRAVWLIYCITCIELYECVTFSKRWNRPTWRKNKCKGGSGV